MYDLAIIGAGAAGIEAARYAFIYKLKAVLIERNQEHFGGVCLNKGCIPAKFYLSHSKHTVSLRDMFNKKDAMVNSLKDNTLKYLRKQGVDIVWGRAHFINDTTLSVDGAKINARHVLIATGSLPRTVLVPENKKIIVAEDIFSFETLPQKFVIVGAGSIGMEMACILRNLDKEVLVVEKEERILCRFDPRLTQRLRVLLERKGINIRTSTDINEIKLDAFDMVLLATGRIAATSMLNLASAGITLSPSGVINVDQSMRTHTVNIYACGDVASSKMYAYTAQYQARLSIESIVGHPVECEYTGIPECVYTIPQLAQVGIREQEARDHHIPIEVKEASFVKFSSSHVYGDTQGYIKVIIDKHNYIRGAAILSRWAAELISIFSLTIRAGLTLNSLKECIFLHPTLSEIIPAFFREES